MALIKARLIYFLFRYHIRQVQTLLFPCFANFIGCASEGAREDALMIAMTIVEPEKAHILAAFAEDFGLALRDITSKCRLSNSAFDGQTLH